MGLLNARYAQLTTAYADREVEVLRIVKSLANSSSCRVR